MRKFLRIAAAACLAMTPIQAAQADVVVELFTSQGCNSCPPADELLGELAKRDGILALSLHVDYWDYLGWKDEFAHPDFTLRQRRYAAVAGASMIYTPQMIVGGQDSIVGTRAIEVTDALQRHAAAAEPVEISAVNSGGSLSVTATPVGSLSSPLVMQIVTYSPAETVGIERGENAGRSLTYHNVVKEWRVMGEWSGAEVWQAEYTPVDGLRAALIVQSSPSGKIVAAKTLN